MISLGFQFFLIAEIAIHKALCTRQEQFKTAALEAKHKGNVNLASTYLRNYKVFLGQNYTHHYYKTTSLLLL